MSVRIAALTPTGVFTPQAVKQLLLGDFNPLYSASGPIDPHGYGRALITKATAAALTLAAPNLADDGNKLQFISSTAAAHTITATGLFQDGAGHTDVATFAAQIGASMILMALNKKWVVLSIQGVTMS